MKSHRQRRIAPVLAVALVTAANGQLVFTPMANTGVINVTPLAP